MRRFDWSFAPTHRSDDRFARQNRFGPPPDFCPASACPCVVHRLSGAFVCSQVGDCKSPHQFSFEIAFTLPSAFQERLRLVHWIRLLGPCFKTGRRGDSPPNACISGARYSCLAGAGRPRPNAHEPRRPQRDPTSPHF